MPPNQYISYWLVGVFVNYLIESKIIFASSCSFVKQTQTLSYFSCFLVFLFFTEKLPAFTEMGKTVSTGTFITAHTHIVHLV